MRSREPRDPAEARDEVEGALYAAAIAGDVGAMLAWLTCRDPTRWGVFGTETVAETLARTDVNALLERAVALMRAGS